MFAEYQNTCFECEEHITNIQHAGDHFRGVLEMVYDDGVLDIAKLEHHFEEMICALGVDFRFPDHTLQLKRKQPQI